MQREFGHFICVCAQVAMSTPWKTAFPLTKSGHENWGKRKKERTWTPRLLLLGNKAQTANRAWHQVEGFTKSFHLLKATPANKEKQSEAMHIDMQTARSNWWSIQNPDPQKKTMERSKIFPLAYPSWDAQASIFGPYKKLAPVPDTKLSVEQNSIPKPA